MSGRDIAREKPQVGAFGARPEVDIVAEDRIPQIGKMAGLGVVEEDRVLDLGGVADDAALADQAVAAQVGTLADLRIVADDGRRFDHCTRLDQYALCRF